MSSTAYTGPLQPKKKSELFDIATALGLSEAASGLTKEAVVGLIKTHLEMNETMLVDAPMFSGLYPRRGPKHRRQQSSAPQSATKGEIETSSDDAVAVHATRLRTRNELSAPPSPERSVISRAQAEAEEEADAVVNAVQLSTEKVKIGAKHAIATTQVFLSNAKTLSSLTLLTEFLVLVSNLSYPSFTVPLPLPTAKPVTLHILYPHTTHLLIFFKWFLPSLILPSLLGSLISFSRSNSQGSDVEVDPLTASIIRLACACAGNWGVADYALQRRWRVLGAAVSLAFGYAEAIAGRG